MTQPNILTAKMIKAYCVSCSTYPNAITEDMKFIPLSIIDKIQAEAEQGCNKKLHKLSCPCLFHIEDEDDCCECEFTNCGCFNDWGNGIEELKSCPSCQTIIQTCKKIRGDKE